MASKLKQGAPFLIYLYYALDNRPLWFRAVWRLSNLFRIVISRFPAVLRLIVSQIIAALVYWPLARGRADGTHGVVDGIDPARSLQASKFLCDAHRRL